MTYIKKGYYTHQRVCKQCNKNFAGRKEQLYCSAKCRNKTYGVYSEWKVSTGTVGAIQELRVSVDLMSKGYEVFRALSPSSSCDLLVLKDKKPISIEVRTAYERHDGEIMSNKSGNYDILALALSNRIVYKPDLP